MLRCKQQNNIIFPVLPYQTHPYIQTTSREESAVVVRSWRRWWRAYSIRWKRKVSVASSDISSMKATCLFLFHSLINYSISQIILPFVLGIINPRCLFISKLCLLILLLFYSHWFFCIYLSGNWNLVVNEMNLQFDFAASCRFHFFWG